MNAGDERILSRKLSLPLLSLLSIVCTCSVTAKEPARAAVSSGENVGVMIMVVLSVFFIVMLAVLLWLDFDRRKKIEQSLHDDIEELRTQLTKQIDATNAVQSKLLEGPESVQSIRLDVLREFEVKLERCSRELLDNINTVDNTLSAQVQEITGAVTKQVKLVTDSVKKESQSTSETLSKEFVDANEAKLQSLRTEYKSALKAMAKAVDQQMTMLQRSLSETHKELVDLVCASKFVDLLDDESFRVDASIELIRKHTNEDKIVELAQMFPSTSVIHILRLLSGKTPEPEVAARLISQSLKVVDELTEANRLEDAARVALQIIEAGINMKIESAELFPIVRKVAAVCKSTNDVALVEELHELFLKLSSDGSGVSTPSDVEEMLEVYKAVYPVEKAEDMHRRIHHCMQAFGRDLDTGALNNLAELAGVLASQSKYDEAYTMLKDIASGLSKAESAQNGELPSVLRSAVQQFIVNGRLEEAADINWKLLDTQQAKHSSDTSESILSELHVIAREYLTIGNYLAASAIERKRAKAIAEGESTPEQRIEVLNDLAEIYSRAEQWDNLAEMMPDMLTKYRVLYGDESDQVIDRLAFAADIMSKIRQYSEESSYLEEAVKTATKLYGQFAEKTVALLLAQADVFNKQARYADAESLFRQIIEEQEKNKDPRLAKTYTSLGDTLSLQKEYEGAEQYFKMALEMVESESGSNHPDILTTLTHLSSLYMTAGRFKDAEPSYKRILEIKYKTLGEHSEEIISSLVHLGELYNIQSNFAEAEVFMETALESAQRIFTEDDNRLADVMIRYSKVLSSVGKEEEAAAVFARAEKIQAGDVEVGESEGEGEDAGDSGETSDAKGAKEKDSVDSDAEEALSEI